jgi:hypothetical protein
MAGNSCAVNNQLPFVPDVLTSLLLKEVDRRIPLEIIVMWRNATPEWHNYSPLVIREFDHNQGQLLRC